MAGYGQNNNGNNGNNGNNASGPKPRKPLTGTFRWNQNKKQQNSPDIIGKMLMPDGKDYFFSAWEKQGQDGSKFFSFTLGDEAKPQQNRSQGQGGGFQQNNGNQSSGYQQQQPQQQAFSNGGFQQNGNQSSGNQPQSQARPQRQQQQQQSGGGGGFSNSGNGNWRNQSGLADEIPFGPEVR